MGKKIVLFGAFCGKRNRNEQGLAGNRAGNKFFVEDTFMGGVLVNYVKGIAVRNKNKKTVKIA